MTHSCRERNCETPCDPGALPEVREIQCPLEKYIACLGWFDLNEFASHLGQYHKDYQDDPNPYFEAEAERRAELMSS